MITKTHTLKTPFRILLVAMTIFLTASCQKAKPTADFKTNNLFTSLLGKSEMEVRNRIDSLWQHFFTPGDLSRYEEDGEQSVYYEVGDSMAFILDTGSDDVRTEGMSYGMMISLQLNKREVFDKLWRWAKTYMAYPADSPWDGYFCWQCKPDGTPFGESNASEKLLSLHGSLITSLDSRESSAVSSSPAVLTVIWHPSVSILLWLIPIGSLFHPLALCL